MLIYHITFISNTYENGVGVIKVIMLVSFFDYVVDSNNRVARGDNRFKVKNKYELIYVMKDRKNISGLCYYRVNIDFF